MSYCNRIFHMLQKEPGRGKCGLSGDESNNLRTTNESVTNNGGNIFGGNNNNHSTTGCNRSNRSMQDDMNSISGLHHAAAQHSFSAMGLTLMGKHNEGKNNFQHHHNSPESNGMKGLLSPSMSTGRTEGDNVMVKEEPEFYETVCNWVDCDRGDLQSQDGLVKVRTYKHNLNCVNQFDFYFSQINVWWLSLC